ncbi:hypothetical protein, partial [Agrobacterium sp. MCAB5]|uniref:hypothetical protein n=1 Tax=Agrobacterium sp. MCAB5 TaxID=3233042 RepID=UPI003F8F6826
CRERREDVPLSHKRSQPHSVQQVEKSPCFMLPSLHGSAGGVLTKHSNAAALIGYVPVPPGRVRAASPNMSAFGRLF